MLFGKKKSTDKTALILDIENGSVGGALAHLSREHAPKLFGAYRVHLPVSHSRDSASLSRGVEKATHSVLAHMSEVAARIRNHAETSALGNISHTSVFFGAPWGTPNLHVGKPDFIPHMQDFVHQEASAFTESPITFHTSADAAVYGARVLNIKAPLVLCLVRGEMSEIIIITEEGVGGYATIPYGHHLLVRTLKTHSNATFAEVQSALSLSSYPEAHEPLLFAQHDFGEQFESVARALLRKQKTGGVVVVGDHKNGWFGKALGEASLEDLFPEGGTVSSLMPHHMSSHIQAKQPSDLFLLLDALFVDGIY